VTRLVFVTLSIGLEDCGRIEIRIETEGKEMPIGRGVGCGEEFLRCLLEITSKAGAILRDGTTAEEKCDRESLPMKIVKAHGLTEFVGEFAIEEFLAVVWEFVS